MASIFRSAPHDWIWVYIETKIRSHGKCTSWMEHFISAYIYVYISIFISIYFICIYIIFREVWTPLGQLVDIEIAAETLKRINDKNFQLQSSCFNFEFETNKWHVSTSHFYPLKQHISEGILAGMFSLVSSHSPTFCDMFDIKVQNIIK